MGWRGIVAALDGSWKEDFCIEILELEVTDSERSSRKSFRVIVTLRYTTCALNEPLTSSRRCVHLRIRRCRLAPLR